MIRTLRTSLAHIFGRKETDKTEKQDSRSGTAFDKPYYEEITRKRIEHLASLNLPVSGKRVIDVGCGIGRLSEYFEQQGCDVLCLDGRAENIQQLREIYPSRKAFVADIETDDALQLGKFDIVFCYGLLYHVVDVHGVIRRLAQMCEGMLLIETCITPVHENILRLVREQRQDVTQALGDWGSRPSPLYVETCLRQSGFEFVYSPTAKPQHPQFGYQFVKGLREWPVSRLTREIFIASHQPIQNDRISLRIGDET